MHAIIIAIHLIVVTALVGVVLLQRSEGGALGVGGGGGFMTGRSQANALTRATAVLAAIFFATSLGLTVLANMGREQKSIFEGVAPAPTQPGAPAGGNVLDQLRQIEEQRAPAAPAAPAAPVAPAAPAAPEAPRQ